MDQVKEMTTKVEKLMEKYPTITGNGRSSVGNDNFTRSNSSSQNEEEGRPIPSLISPLKYDEKYTRDPKPTIKLCNPTLSPFIAHMSEYKL